MGIDAKERLPLQHLLAQMKGSHFKQSLIVVYPLRTQKSITRTKNLRKIWKNFTDRCSVWQVVLSSYGFHD